jgi:MscS family membrane protein
MTNKTVRNIGKRPFIKRAMTIGVTYRTQPEKVQQAVDIIKDILDKHEGMSEEFPARVYFNEFSAYSLDIMVIYWYHPPDYWSYMAFSERVNMEILQRFNREEIAFAFPTQTLHVERMEQV